MKYAIRFSNVYKSYPLYAHLTGGIKNVLFNFYSSLKMFRGTSYRVLNGISFDIKQGECVGMVGGNGVGKSTVLGLIAGVLRQDSGVIERNGRVTPLLELGSGFHPDLTGLENIKLNGVLIGHTRKKVEQHLDEIVEFSEIGDYIDQPVRMYSSGMIARLGFSIASFLDPQILLVDETMTVGDIGFQNKCYKKLEEFKQKGVTIVVVSHLIEDIEKVCDRVIWLTNKGIAMEGEVSQVILEYKKHFEHE